jgi:predicted transcriptional regulator
MRTAVVRVGSLADGVEDFKRAWKTRKYQGEYVTFDSLETLLSTLTSRRWQLLGELQAGGKMSLRELARRAGRDVKRVHEDVHKLIDVGLVVQEDDGVHVPFDEIRAEFEMRRQADAIAGSRIR